MRNASARARLTAAVWLLAVLAMAAYQLHFWRQDRLDTDLLALLPVEEHSPPLAAATSALASQSTDRVVVLLGAPSWPQARSAAAAFDAALEGAPLRRDAGVPVEREALLSFYRPFRDRLLTPDQRARLRDSSPEALADAALAGLYQPAAGPRLLPWPADPLGLWTGWWRERAAESPLRVRDDMLTVEADALHWAVLFYRAEGGAFALQNGRPLGAALDRAAVAARRAQPELRLLRAGIPLHAEAAARQAQREVSTIGLGAAAGLLLLVWLVFRSPRPIPLLALSLLVGFGFGLSACVLVFGSLHLLTLVFGATLIGVAVDYGFHYFTTRAAGEPAGRHLRRLAPALTLALGSSVLAYLALVLAPFPGLRQMAVFAAAGLTGAFLTVLCWFPLLERPDPRPPGRLASAVAASLSAWPRLRRGRESLVAAAVVVFLLAGLARLQAVDDVRQLHLPSPDLVEEQSAVARVLRLPSPAQFFVVEGADAEQVLAREETLTARLDALVAQGRLGGYRAVSAWLPSAARQSADAALTQAVESALLQRVGARLGEDLSRPAFAPAPLTLTQWRGQPATAALQAQWLGELPAGQGSVVLLSGVTPAGLPALAAAASASVGVHWVDRPAEVSALMARYRVAMGALLGLGHAVVLALLLLRFGRRGWRAWAPAAAASLCCLGLLGWLGEPLQLFHLLGLLVLLGMALDYGIFLLAHPDGRTWLAVCLGAATTLLAFGLLALSSTPALRAFGLTLLLGVGSAWLLAPLFRPDMSISPSN